MLRALMFVICLYCVGNDELITHAEEPYRVCVCMYVCV
jgi:hypothetical protein